MAYLFFEISALDDGVLKRIRNVILMIQSGFLSTYFCEECN